MYKVFIVDDEAAMLKVYIPPLIGKATILK